MFRRVLCRSLAGLLAMGAGAVLAQEPFPRSAPRAGAIVAAKGGEELQFLREPSWRPAIVRQDVVGGDTLRTGEIGTLGITFADQTTIRVGRQSTLVVNQIAAASATGNTELTVPTGNVWARASRGGSGVTVKTPAASAAIRGTDWSLSVQGDRTSLVVLEGVVEFSNPQGSVTVRQGEGASARIGERPTKIILVRPDDREQMMFYLELRALFRGLPATRLEGAARRSERSRLAAIPATARTTEDWVAIAENGLGHDRPALVLQAVAEARRRLGQSPAFIPGPNDDWSAGAREQRAGPRHGNLSARLDLVEAMLAGLAKRYKEAAALFARAERGTTGRQRQTAQCGYFAAATMADPKRVRPLPREGNADQNICAAFAVAFGKGLEDAETILSKNEKAAPNHLLSGMLSAQVSLLLNRRDEMRATVERMRKVDPDSPETLLASGYLKSAVDSDLDGAVADLLRGVEIAPGDSTLWNALGLTQSSRDANQESEAAFREAIAVDPSDPVPYANLAILLLDQSRVEEAGALIDKALALDPSLHVAYSAKARYFLQTGNMAKALEFALAGSAANPASAQSLLVTAVTQYQSGDLDVSAQALDNADRLDRNDPVTSIVRTAIAVDQMDADAAIINAREAVRRYRNRGGYFAALASTRSGGSYLGQAYRLLNLEEWARFYTDRVADSFTATSYFDQANARRANPFFTRPTLEQVTGSDASSVAGSLAIQGLMLDPLAVAGRIGRIDLLKTPFVDAEIGASAIQRNGRAGWQQDVLVQAFGSGPVPTSVSISAGQERTASRRGAAGGVESRNASLFVGMAPSAADRFLFWGTASSGAPDLVSPDRNLGDADANKLKSYQLGAGWSHTLGYRNVVTATILASRADQSQERFALGATVDPFFGMLPSLLEGRTFSKARVDSVSATLGHAIGFGDFTLRTGLEGAVGRISGHNATYHKLSIPAIPFESSDSTFDPVTSRFTASRAYGNLIWQPSDMFQVEGGLHIVTTGASGLGSRTYADPRIGIAFSPMEGHWLRAAWRRDGGLPTGFTLSPITTAGLLPNQLPVELGGRTETLALRWDAEWTRNVFTSVEYQSQQATKLRIGLPDTFDHFDIQKAKVDYVTATANIWLTHGIGVFGTVGIAESKTPDGAGGDVDMPFVPRRFARAGVTFVHPSRIKLSVVENYIGERYDAPGGIKLDPFWTTDLTATYETPDRRFLFSLAVLNLFDKRYDQVAARASSDAIPGAGRTIAGSLKVRF
jgi:tetratricopeptide (TPR) repeat protein